MNEPHIQSAVTPDFSPRQRGSKRMVFAIAMALAINAVLLCLLSLLNEQVHTYAPAPQHLRKIIFNEPPITSPPTDARSQETDVAADENMHEDAAEALPVELAIEFDTPPLALLDVQLTPPVIKQPNINLSIELTPAKTSSKEAKPQIDKAATPTDPAKNKQNKRPVLSQHNGQADAAVQALPGNLNPAYPKRLRNQSRSVEGKVIVKFLVDEDGRVTTVQILEGHPALAKEVTSTLRRWRYKPAVKDGRRAQEWVKKTFEFKLTD